MPSLTLIRDVTLVATEEVTVTLPPGRDLAWLDMPEGQEWLSAHPNPELIVNDLLDATPWRLMKGKTE